MKTKLFLFIILLVSITSCTKTEKTYYPDGHVQSIVTYKFGKEHGKTLYYYDTPNTLEIEVTMKRGKRHGDFKRYFKNGLLDTHCQYVNDSIEGNEVSYTANGEKSQEFTYVSGKKNGPHKAYYISGDIKIEGNFKNDLFDGDWKYYDERGIMIGEGTFNEGAGSVTFYNEHGHPLRETHYKNNKKEGKEIFFSPTGSIYKTIVFKQDRIISEEIDSSLLQ